MWVFVGKTHLLQLSGLVFGIAFSSFQVYIWTWYLSGQDMLCGTVGIYLYLCTLRHCKIWNPWLLWSQLRSTRPKLSFQIKEKKLIPTSLDTNSLFYDSDASIDTYANESLLTIVHNVRASALSKRLRRFRSGWR